MSNNKADNVSMIKQSFASFNSQASNFQQITQQILQRIPSYIHSELECPVCLQFYNLTIRIPLIICENSHGCCQSCMNDLLKKQKLCMFCRKQIIKQKVHRNRFIVKVIDGQMQRKKKLRKQIKKLRKQNQSKNQYYTNQKHNNNQMRRQLLNDQWQEYDQIMYNQEYIDKSSQSLNQKLLSRSNPHANKSSYHEENMQKYQKLESDQSKNGKLNCGVEQYDQYCITYVQILIVSVPFIACEGYLSLYDQLGARQCVQQQNPTIPLSIQQWLISSAAVGLFIYCFQVIVLIKNFCFRNDKQCLRKMVLLLTIMTQFKIGFYNFVGIYLFFSVSSQNRQSYKCSQSLIIYMNVFFWVYIFYFIPHFFWFFYSIKQFTQQKKQKQPNRVNIKI